MNFQSTPIPLQFPEHERQVARQVLVLQRLRLFPASSSLSGSFHSNSRAKTSFTDIAVAA